MIPTYAPREMSPTYLKVIRATTTVLTMVSRWAASRRSGEFEVRARVGCSGFTLLGAQA